MSKTFVGKLVAFGFIAALFFAAGFRATAQEPPLGSNAEKLLQIKEKLELSDGQVARLKDMLKKEKAELAPLVRAQLGDLNLLKKKVLANAPDAELSPILDKMENRRQEIESVKNKYVGEARTILTPTQQAKVVLGVVKAKGEALKKLKALRNK